MKTVIKILLFFLLIALVKVCSGWESPPGLSLGIAPLVGAALVTGGVGLVNSLMGNASQRKANKQNIELQDKQFAHDINMWKMQNAYNTPAAQMARFKDAGLNPHLMYGQGTPGNATGAPTMKPTKVEPTWRDLNTGEVIGQYMALKKDQSQIDLLQEQKRVVEEQATAAQIKNDMLGMKRAIYEDMLGADLSFRKGQLANIESQIALRLKQEGLTGAQAEWAKKKIEKYISSGGKINIDRDSGWERLLWDRYGETIFRVLDKIDSRFSQDRPSIQVTDDMKAEFKKDPWMWINMMLKAAGK